MVSDRLQCATISSAIAVGLTQVSCLAFGMSLRLTGVSMVDGARAMAEMFSFLSSSARATVKAATAALDAQSEIGHRGAAAQHAGNEVHGDLLLQDLGRAVGDGRIGKSAGDVHDGMKRRQPGVEAVDRG